MSKRERVSRNGKEIHEAVPRESTRFVVIAIAGILASFVLPIVASANCCELIKVDPDTPPATVRACSPTAGGACDQLLFVGTLGLGESQSVCVPAEIVLYAEYDDEAQAFGDYVEAVCETDVEL